MQKQIRKRRKAITRIRSDSLMDTYGFPAYGFGYLVSCVSVNYAYETCCEKASLTRTVTTS